MECVMERTFEGRAVAEVGQGAAKAVRDFDVVDGRGPNGLLEAAELFVLKGALGEGDDQVVFGGVGGEEFGVEAAEKLVESGIVEGGRGGGGGAKAVAAAILGGAGFALGGAGSGGALGVGAVGPDLGGRRHEVLLLL
jgi:hypothetical protein